MALPKPPYSVILNDKDVNLDIYNGKLCPLDIDYTEMVFNKQILVHYKGEPVWATRKDISDTHIEYVINGNIVIANIDQYLVCPDVESEKEIEQKNIQYIETNSENLDTIYTKRKARITNEINRLNNIVNCIKHKFPKNHTDKQVHVIFNSDTTGKSKKVNSTFLIYYTVPSNIRSEYIKEGVKKYGLVFVNPNNSGDKDLSVIRFLFIRYLDIIHEYIQYLKTSLIVISRDPKYLNKDLYYYNDILENKIKKINKKRFRESYSLRDLMCPAFLKNRNNEEDPYTSTNTLLLCRVGNTWHIFADYTPKYGPNYSISEDTINRTIDKYPKVAK